MYTFFVFGSFLFWVLVVLTFCLLTRFVNRNKEDDGYISTTIFVLALGVFFGLGNHDLFFSLIDFIKNSPLTFFGYIAGYLAIGSIWSFIKWYYYLVDYRQKYLEQKNSTASYKPTLRVPLAKEHKGDIIMWMSYWVVSVFWTLIHRWVTKIWSTLYFKFEGLYNKLSNSVFKDLVDEEEKEKAESDSKKTTK